MLTAGRANDIFHRDGISDSTGASPAMPLPGASKATYAFQVDGVGDGKAPLVLPTVALVVDDTDVPDDTSTTATIDVDGDHIISQIHTVGDQDFYRVVLEAGQNYEIGNYLYVGGPSGVPLSDAYIELYDDAGNLIVSADGGGPNTPSGLDALLAYTAEYSGTYFINARAYDQDPTNGTTGDGVGDYELFVNDVTDDPNAYRPYYDTDNPLYAIDWGSQVDNSVRNPDGAETGHITGNETGTPDNPFAPLVDGKNVITIYFAQAGDIFTSEDPTNPGLPPITITATGVQQWERDVVFSALQEFEKVADVVYVEVHNRDQANFLFTTYQGTPGPGVSLLGSMGPPQENDEGLAQFNSGDYRWNEQDLQQGGFSFVTLIHEFGHGHGLAHPHDNGGRSGIMNGVTADGPVADYTLGDYNLNQGVFTMMSYQDGWQSSPYGNAPTDAGYGYLGGLMAFDIAAIQDKYGVNEDTATGDDIYSLRNVNAPGTFFYSIWDAGGTDMIRYGRARDTTIDLRAATLQYEEGGGGRVSFADGVFGGFTIANGVTIEIAMSGSGNDTLIGNGAGNMLYARSGTDSLDGGGGDDLLDGGTGADTMAGGTGDDRFFVNDAGDAVIENADEGLDTVLTYIDYTLADNVENLTLLGRTSGTGNTLANEIRGSDTVNTLSGLGGEDVLRGYAGADTLIGGDGDDALFGGIGEDVLTGGLGADEFTFREGDLIVRGNRIETITDFRHDQGDRLVLRNIDADTATDGNQAFAFIGNGAFTGSAGELRYAQNGGDTFVYGDTDGDGVADFQFKLEGVTGLVAGDFVL